MGCACMLAEHKSAQARTDIARRCELTRTSMQGARHSSSQRKRIALDSCKLTTGVKAQQCGHDRRPSRLFACQGRTALYFLQYRHFVHEIGVQDGQSGLGDEAPQSVPTQWNLRSRSLPRLAGANCARAISELRA